MGMTTPPRAGLCRRCGRGPSVNDRAHPQPLITAIPALVKMSQQVVEDGIGLVLDPWSWRVRLFGTPPMQIARDIDSRPEPTHKVYRSDPAPQTKDELDSHSDLTSHRDTRSMTTPAAQTKRAKKTVHFVEPECRKKRPSDLDLPAERSKLELYEVVLPAEDTLRVIDVDYDLKNNRWCIDESAPFPEREDMVAMICSKSVLRAMEGGVSTTEDSYLATSTSKPQFQVNRLPDYVVIKIPDGGPATIKASSHDLFHIGNLEKFLLHTHKNLRQAIAASGGHYMKHWLIDLRQLMTILSDLDTRRNCKSAFWDLVGRGFAEKVTLQLWDVEDPQPKESGDIEVSDWTTWMRAHKATIPEALRQDLHRALDFFRSQVVPGSLWNAVLHPNISIMSHKGLTSAFTTNEGACEGANPFQAEPWCPWWSSPDMEPLETWSPWPSPFSDAIPHKQLGKADLNGAPTLPNSRSAHEGDETVISRVPSASDARSLRQAQHLVTPPSPVSYPQSWSLTLPASFGFKHSAKGDQDSEGSPRPFPRSSDLPRPSEPLVSKEHSRRTHEALTSDTFDSATPFPKSRPSSSTIPSDLSITSSDLADADETNEEWPFVTHEQAVAEVDYGKATGGLVEPSGGAPSTFVEPQLDENRVAERGEQKLREPKAGTSAHGRQRIHLADPDLADSYRRSVEIEERAFESWKHAVSIHGSTDDNSVPPILDVDVPEDQQAAFSYQLDEALSAEQRITRSAMATQEDLETARKEWLGEEEMLWNEPRMKRELKELLVEEWDRAHGAQEIHRPWRKVVKPTRAVKDALRQYHSENLLAQIECLSNKRPDRPFDSGTLWNDNNNNNKNNNNNNNNATRSEMGTCRQQRACEEQMERANQAAEQLRRLLDAADERAKEDKGRLEQKSRELEEMSVEFALLKDSLRPNTKEGHVLAPADGSFIDCSQALFEDVSQWHWGGAPLSIQLKGAKDKNVPEDLVQQSPTPEDGDAILSPPIPLLPNGGMNGAHARLHSTSPSSPNRRLSYEADAGPEADTKRIQPASNGFHHAAPAADPPAAESDDSNTVQTKGNAAKESDKLASCSDSGGDGVIHISPEAMKLAYSNETELDDENKDVPNDAIPNDVSVQGLGYEDLTNGVNAVLVSGPKDLDNGAPIASFRRLSNGLLSVTASNEGVSNDPCVAASEELPNGFAGPIEQPLPNGHSVSKSEDVLNGSSHQPPSSGKKNETLKKCTSGKRNGKRR